MDFINSSQNTVNKISATETTGAQSAAIEGR